MKLVFRNMILVACLFVGANAKAQKVDTAKRNSVHDLIELENSKNLVPTTKSNPPVCIQNNSEPKTPAKPKKTGLKSGNKKKF